MKPKLSKLFRNNHQRKPVQIEPRLALALAMLALMILPSVAFAADSGDDSLGLGELLDWVVGLLRGPLGKICALVSFAAGMIGGAARGNFTALLVGVAFAVAFYYGPGIILNVFGAVI